MMSQHNVPYASVTSKCAERSAQQDGSVANVQTQTLSLLTALCYPTKLKGFGAQTGTVRQQKCATGNVRMAQLPHAMLPCSQNVCQCQVVVAEIPCCHVLRVLRHGPPAARAVPGAAAAPLRRPVVARRLLMAAVHSLMIRSTSSPALRSRNAHCTLPPLARPLRAHTPSIWSCSSTTKPRSDLMTDMRR